MLELVVEAARREPAVLSAPPPAVVVGSGALAVVLVLLLWSVVGHLVTFAHEGGHALVALLLGARVVGIRLHSDRTGVTEYTQPLLRLPVTAAGYLAPSGFGLLGAVAIASGRAEAMLWAGVVLLALLLLATRNGFGRFAVLLTGGALLGTLQRGSGDVRAGVACVLVWLLLVGGLVHVLRDGPRGVDFGTLRGLTWIVPATLWAALASVAAAAALVYGGLLLLGGVAPPG